MNMDKALSFAVFCLESYKSVHNLTGAAAYDIFAKHKVFEYVSKHYDVLHSTGKLYIVSDIDEYIANRKQ